MPYFIKNGDLNYSEFVEAIKKINSATSITGIDYTDIQVVGDKVVGTRASTNNQFSISLKRLYEAYCNILVFTTADLKPYVNRVQSPSLAILRAINAIKEGDDVQPDLMADPNCDVVISKESFGESYPWLKKFLITFFIAGLIMLLSQLFPESKVENGRLTDAAHTEAVMAIKSQISNPSSYEGGSWNDAVWDSNSQTKRYVLKHNFTCKTSFGERVRYMAFIYFDVNGKATDIEILEY